MTEKSFDAAGFVQIDLKSGTIRTPGDTTMALIPVDLFAAIPATDELKEGARIFGNNRGKIFRQNQVLSSASMAVLAQHLQGEIALIGAGNTSIDVFGDALIVKIHGPMTGYRSAAVLLEGFVAGYISAVSESEFNAISSQMNGSGLGIFVGNPDAVKVIYNALSASVPLMDAILRLKREVA